MSLLNEALRKKSSEIKKTDNLDFIRKQPTSHQFNRKNLSRISGGLLILSCLILGAWYFLGSLSARENMPIAANSAAEVIERNESNPISEPKENHTEKVEPESIIEKPNADISPLQEFAKIEPVKNDRESLISRPEKVSAPITSTVKKVQRRIQKDAVQKAPKEKADPLPSHEEDLFFQKALRYHREDKLNQAIQMYQQVIRVNPDHRDALFNLSSAYIQLADYSDAYPLLKQLRVIDQRNPDVLVNLAIVEIGLGRPAEAIRLLDMAANQYAEPQFGIYFHRAAALSRLGKLEEARISYKKAEKLNAGHNYLIFNLAVLSDKLQRYDEAVQYYGQFLQQSDTLPPREKKNIEARIRSLHAYLGAKLPQTEVNSER